MKLLIVVPRSAAGGLSSDYRYLFPLGLAYISSMLKKAGHDVDCLNLNHYDGPIENLMNQSFSKKRYDYVLTGGLSTSYKQIKSVSDAVHTLDHSVGLILGGGLISSEPELMFNTLQPDYIVIGEGEKTICELLECLENKEDIGNIAGIGYRNNQGKTICTKPQTPIDDLDSIPYPDFEGFEFDKYLDRMRPNDQYFYDLFDYPRVYPIVCSRSCPFLCTFCFHPVGNKYRQRSVNSIIDELSIMIRKYRINTIAIYDELFSNSRDWLYEFCRRFKQITAELPWECRWSCQMRVDKLDDEMLKTMKDAGCYMVSYGFESHSPIVLKSMRKHITPVQIDRAVNSTLKHNLSIQANFIFGDRAETVQTAKETLDYWKNNNHAGIMLAFINPYPGTTLYKHCLEKGVIKDKLDFIENHISDIINMTDKITDSEFEKLKLDLFEADLKYRICTVPVSLKKEKDTGTYTIHVKCPHCNENIEYRNYIITYKLFFGFKMYCRQCRRRFFLMSRLYQYVTKSYLLLSPVMSRRMKIAASHARGHVIKIRDRIRRWVKRVFNRFFYNVESVLRRCF